MRDILRFGLILMAYSLIAGTALALVGQKTRPMIEENMARAENEARNRVLIGMNGGFELIDESDAFPVWIAYRDEGRTETGGYIFIADGNGYSSTIRTMVGVGADNRTVGIEILFQQETPGLGTKICEVRRGETAPYFLSQFLGKTSNDAIVLSRDGGSIDGISGATISSRAVTLSINKGLVKLQDKLGGYR